jgi:hypothetical protein
MAELLEPTARRRREPSRRDSRNRTRASAGGPRPERRICEAPIRSAGIDELRFIPDDPATVDGAPLAGRSVAEAAPDSTVRRSLEALASQITALPAPPLARRRRGA